MHKWVGMEVLLDALQLDASQVIACWRYLTAGWCIAQAVELPGMPGLV